MIRVIASRYSHFFGPESIIWYFFFLLLPEFYSPGSKSSLAFASPSPSRVLQSSWLSDNLLQKSQQDQHLPTPALLCSSWTYIGSAVFFAPSATSFLCQAWQFGLHVARRSWFKPYQSIIWYQNENARPPASASKEHWSTLVLLKIFASTGSVLVFWVVNSLIVTSLSKPLYWHFLLPGVDASSSTLPRPYLFVNTSSSTTPNKCFVVVKRPPPRLQTTPWRFSYLNV